MVFPSLPIYLDPPNWPQQQQPNNQQVGIFPQQNSPRPRPPQPPPSTDIIGGGGGTGSGYQGSIRPGSMADRARLAKIHQPDATLKCPRCESTNTKFCYYNNYNLSQPRHFCKTCRRYWTRGGALRNVPVGGGCRRNKRSKGNNSKSPMKSDHRQGANNGSSSTSANSSSNGISTNAMVGHLQTQTPTTQFPFLASLQHYNSDYVSGNIGSHFGTRNGNGTSSGSDIGEFQIGVGSSSGNNGGSLLSPNGLGEQWRLPNLQQIHHQHQSQQQPQQHHQFPFLTNVEPQIGLFQFGGENNADHGGRFNSSKAIDSSSVSGMVMPQHDNTVKVEGNEGLNLPKNLLSISGNDPFWNNGSGNAWSEEAPSFAPSPNHYL